MRDQKMGLGTKVP